MLFFALLTFQMTMKVQNLEAESEGKSVERFKKLIKTLSKISKFIISASFFTGIFWGFLTRSHQHRNPQRKYSHSNIFQRRKGNTDFRRGWGVFEIKTKIPMQEFAITGSVQMGDIVFD